MSFFLQRAFINPVLVTTGILTLITGLLLFFHMKSHLIAHTHEICSLVFSVSCVLHLILNRISLIHSMKGRLYVFLIATFVIVTTVVLLYSGVTAQKSPFHFSDKHRVFGYFLKNH